LVGRSSLLSLLFFFGLPRKKWDHLGNKCQSMSTLPNGSESSSSYAASYGNHGQSLYDRPVSSLMDALTKEAHKMSRSIQNGTHTYTHIHLPSH
jgi:hypothetical protein